MIAVATRWGSPVRMTWILQYWHSTNVWLTTHHIFGWLLQKPAYAQQSPTKNIAIYSYLQFNSVSQHGHRDGWKNDTRMNHARWTTHFDGRNFYMQNSTKFRLIDLKNWKWTLKMEFSNFHLEIIHEFTIDSIAHRKLKTFIKDWNTFYWK